MGNSYPLRLGRLPRVNAVAALAQLAPLTENFQIEMDCMVMEPEQYLDTFVSLQIPRVIIHYGSTEQFAVIAKHAATHSYALGLAFTNDAPLEEVKALIPQVSFIQIMGIKEVGKQGQPFDERTLETARTLRAEYPDLEIAVDGHVNKETIVPLKEVGVNRFAPGSAIAKQSDPKAAYEELVAMVSQSINN